MSSKVFSIATPKSGPLQIKIDTRETEGGKWRTFIRETQEGGIELPVRIGTLEKIGEGDSAFMVIRAPLRVRNEDGTFQTRARQRDGKFLDEEGKEVATAEQAAREFVLMTHRNDASKLVFGQIATINVKNFKQDKTPTAMTLLNFKIYSDEEALEAERKHHQVKTIGKDHADYEKGVAELKDLRRKAGVWADFFINAGHDVLREMGWSIRERAPKGQAADNAPTF